MNRQIEPLLGYNINVISHFLKNMYNEKLSEYGLTNAQAKVIYFLAKHGEQSQSDLQNRLYIKASSMNGIIESLLKNECITKDSSRKDKRTKVIQLTEKGEELDQTIWTIIQEIEAEITKDFSEEEQRVIVSWLNKIQRNLTEGSDQTDH
ncbi:MarR family transcriptional regulator [Halobacillus andaensis]|uniref:MarR family transcriptional regulator n=1 Tax=Halobacillus andaensis TaxID=1176239 RepID=A0A917B9P7_HALAA|nr:MarR family transcriptional regulator [Halobacillus andaensis]MBP2006214.1 DNA-binding MarR family transcriptional regulator [Halobacillus andaensis]GGF33327.1 MarR family transcriptional regulator [Halobacillus andaensis]